MIDKLLNKEVQKFIQDHLYDDPVSLMLQSGKYPHLPMREIADQIKARQRLKKKLPEWVNNPFIIFPVTLSQEQSSSNTSALYKTKIISGNTIVDLTGGAGIDSWQFSTIFKEVIYVEPNELLFEISQHNLNLLGLGNIQYYKGTAEDFLKVDFTADWIYLDPDRRGGSNEKLFKLSDCQPDVLTLIDQIWNKAPAVLIKTSPMLDITETIKVLEKVESVHVVAIDNEVKEVLYILKKNSNNKVKIHTINFSNESSVQDFQFDFDTEKTIEQAFSDIKEFLYEPNAAILKAGAFKSLMQKYPVIKLHPNTHLYTSDQLISGFPGRVFEVKNVIPFHKKKLLANLPEKKANITTRNFPDSVEEIRKKTGIKDGGDIYLFAATDVHNKNIIIKCIKVNLK